MATDSDATIVIREAADDVAPVAGPAPEDLYGDTALRVLVDDTPAAPAADPEKLALLERLQAAEAKAATDATTPLATIAKGFETLSSRLGQAAPSAAQPAQVEDFEAVKKRLNEKYFDDPTAAGLELLERYKSFEDANAVKRNLAVSYELAGASETDRAFLTKYKSEIDAEVARLPPDVRQNDPSAVKRAMRFVRADHFDELVAEKLAASTPAPVASPVAAHPAAQYAEAPGARAVPAEHQVRVTSQQKAMIDQLMERFPISESDAYKQLSRRGWRF